MCLESIIHVYCCKCLNIWQIIGLQGRKGLGPFLFALWVKILKLSEVSKETEVKHFFFSPWQICGCYELGFEGNKFRVNQNSAQSSMGPASTYHLCHSLNLQCAAFFFFFILKRPKRDASTRNILFKSTLIQVIYLKKSTT